MAEKFLRGRAVRETVKFCRKICPHADRHEVESAVQDRLGVVFTMSMLQYATKKNAVKMIDSELYKELKDLKKEYRNSSEYGKEMIRVLQCGCTKSK